IPFRHMNHLSALLEYIHDNTRIHGKPRLTTERIVRGAAGAANSLSGRSILPVFSRVLTGALRAGLLPYFFLYFSTL
ncbi:hypothetical protein, partial [Salmonella enterica]|uniref:hypothetical protein n=1 Tax=Salmonella enterica TaxID=28901 RepID=UPI001F15D0B6